MWFLTNKKTGQKYAIFANKPKHSVGRSNCDLILPSDTSISRTHVYLYPEDKFVKLIDCGSKYGTFLNDGIENQEPIDKNEEFNLVANDRVQFGRLGNEWILTEVPIKIITSTLSTKEKHNLLDDIKILNGTVLNDWSADCTHLVMPSLTVTIKTLKALVAGIPIVLPAYFKKSIENETNGLDIPQYEKFIPPLVEEFLIAQNVTFSIDTTRKEIFKGLKFVFMIRNHMNLYKDVIEMAGGKCTNLEDTKTPKHHLVTKKVVVIKYQSTSESQSSQVIDQINEYVCKKGLRLVSEREIGLAIVHKSIMKFCNPRYNLISDLIPDQVNTAAEPTPVSLLQENTPIVEESSEKLSQERVRQIEIPETMESVMSESIDDNKNNGSKLVKMDANIDDVINANKNKRKLSDIATKPNKRIHIENPSPEEPLHSITINTSQRNSFNLSGFLSKSPTRPHTTPDFGKQIKLENINNNKRSVPTSNKRTFNDLLDSDDDGLFSFSDDKPSKKTKHSDQQVAGPSTSTLRRRGKMDNQIGDSVDGNQRTKSNVFNSINSESISSCIENSESMMPALEITPIAITPDGWLTRSMSKVNLDGHTTHIKQEKMDNTKDEKTTVWIDSIRNAFEVKVKPMHLVSRTNNTIRSVGSNNNGSTKSDLEKRQNFKAFVKKQNYKRQTELVKTNPQPINHCI